MLGMRINDGEGRYGEPGQELFATFDSSNDTITYLDNTSGLGDANQISVNLGMPFAIVTYPAWEAYHLQARAFVDATVDPPVRLTGPKGHPGTRVLGPTKG